MGTLTKITKESGDVAVDLARVGGQRARNLGHCCHKVGIQHVPSRRAALHAAPKGRARGGDGDKLRLAHGALSLRRRHTLPSWLRSKLQQAVASQALTSWSPNTHWHCLQGLVMAARHALVLQWHRFLERQHKASHHIPPPPTRPPARRALVVVTLLVLLMV